MSVGSIRDVSRSSGRRRTLQDIRIGLHGGARKHRKADMLPLLAFLWCTTSAYALTCHCLNGSPCHANGFCVEGCEKGWYGPGCQVGNVALRKPAIQSSTYTDFGYAGSADRAVDGNVPNDDSSVSCTHTEAYRQSAWWVVTLNSTHDYVITNVTLVNRKGYNSYRLANFVILYSEEANSSDPNPTDSTWREFARENDTVGASRTYTCNRTVIAKRVAVFLTAFPPFKEGILTLCEVQIYGYEHRDCPNGFTGPGCLLRACDQCVSNDRYCTGDFSSCNYDVCPDDSLLPPDCWITLSNFSGLSVQSTPTCNSVLFSAVLRDSQPNIAATSLELEVTTSSDLLVLESATFSLPASDSTNYKFSNAAADTSYNASVKLRYCNTTLCFHTTRSKIFTARTGKREYAISSNNSCVFINVSSATPHCELPTVFQVTCEAQGINGNNVNSSDRTTCGLDRHRGYNCSFAAIIDANAIESLNSYIIAAEPLTTSPSPEANVAVIAGSIGGSVALIVIIVAILAAVYCRRKRNEKSDAFAMASDANGYSRETTGVRDVTNLPSCNNAGHVADDGEQTYGNTSGMTLSQFQLYVQNEALIARRFSELQANEAHPCTQGRSPENKVKNRFQNILPYDTNRVRLTSLSNDYINASYINGFSKPKEYIAAQGPSPKTVEDFWQMLWQEKCSVIIMLTDYVEHAKRKCEKYFPYSTSNGIPIEVTVRSSTVLDTHTVTLLDVRQGSEVRLVHHFHFLAWPDQSVPTHSAELLLFYSRICLLLKRQPSRGPLMVHCSAGVGRTGAYIAFNYLQQRYQSDGTVDVDNCVVKLRDQRMLMVQTKEQYLFLHKAVLYGFKTIRYIYDAAQLPSLARSGTSSKSSVDLTKTTEWQELQAVVPKFPEQNFVTAMLPENRLKNRRSQILALEPKRALPSRLDDGSQLYINAVYCNGCYSNRAFIATQFPLRRTVDDFWIMVYDCQPSCIIVLHDLPSSDNEDCPSYWPDPGRSITAGCLEVKCLKDEKARTATMPGYDISLSPASGRMAANQAVSTKLFTTSLWDIKSSQELPVNANEILEVANALRTYCLKVPQQPIIVQCRDGVTQSGLFLSAVNALHRLMETEQVSVFHTVDLLRTSRPEFVTSEAQYRFIYKILETYRDSSSVYANT